MTPFNRRQFLKFAGLSLGSLGFNCALFQHQARRYGQVLAQSTPRKLALLVGINQYPDQPLEGCLNDVDLQRHLLIHRFGFNPKDILVVGDREATRTGILTAFEEHLIKQARPGDVVVYHYSGHGSRIADPNPILSEPKRRRELNGTFVPVDSQLPAGYPEQGGSVQDIMGHTLFLLMSALKTENVTVVLDSCFAGGATRQETVRSRSGGSNILVSSDEKTYQQQWLSRLQMSPSEFVNGYRRGVAKGVVLAATAPDQLAREAVINGFHAGLFTYILTYYLWREQPNVEELFQDVVLGIPERFDQNPRYEIKPGSPYDSSPPYFIDNPQTPAQAVVTEVSRGEARLWLGSVDLPKVETGTIFTAVDGSGQVRVLSRDGIVAAAKIENPVTPGTLLRLKI
ncbi:MAG: caspase family protein [Cyanobacteria bacterium J007]|nr:MAG: caspase family protein [Cyanobacteria bacterium J007]